MSPINHHPDIQVSLPLAVEPPLNPGLARARQSLGQGGRGSSFCPLCSVSSLFQPYPHFSGPGTCLLSCTSGSPCRCPLYLVAVSPTCFTWPEISVFPTEPLPEVGQTMSPSTSPSRLLPRWSLPCARMHSRSPPHYWPL